MAEWWSIEVFHSELPAGRWRDSYSSTLIESAVATGATGWEWHEHRWGVVFEAEFAGDAQWEQRLDLTAVAPAGLLGPAGSAPGSPT